MGSMITANYDSETDQIIDASPRLNNGVANSSVPVTAIPSGRGVAGEAVMQEGTVGRKYLSAIHKPLSDQISLGGSANTLASQHWSKHKFVGLRVWFPNYYDSAATVIPCKVAPCAVSAADGQGLTWTNATFGGLNTFSIAAGKQATGGSQSVNDVPGWTPSDIISVPAIERTDGGAGYLAHVRAYFTSAFAGQLIVANTVDTAAYNAQTGQDWLSATTAGDAVSTIGAITTYAPMRWIMPVVEFFYDKPTVRVSVFGDSLQQGQASTGNHYGPIMRACELLDTDDKYVVPMVCAISGQAAGYSRNTVLKFLQQGLRPSVIVRNVWSPNTALSSDTVLDQIKGYIAAEIGAAREMGIPFVLGTSGPVDNQSAAEVARRETLNAWARSLYALGQVAALADWAPLVTDPAATSNRLPAIADGATQSHYLDAGYAIIAQCFADAIKPLI